MPITTNLINSTINKPEAISEAVKALSAGNLIIFPTETVYGLGCDFFNAESRKKIYEIKSRSPSKQIAGYISNIKMINQLVDFLPEIFYKISEKFLPGPLTIILKSGKNIISRGFGDTIGIRYPKNDVTLEIIESFGKPMAGTSANISGESSPVFAMVAFKDFEGLIALIIDDGPTCFGAESTVIDISTGKPVLLREGAIRAGEIEDTIDLKFNN